jgi:hypothetical protein
MKQVEALIRGEISAIESIDAVLGKINDSSEKEKLTSIRQDHYRAAESLKQYSTAELRGETNSSGPWGAFTQAFAGGASFFGDKAALGALKIGEQHGVNEYREALASSNVSPELKTLIQNELLPQQEQHLAMINGYLQ